MERSSFGGEARVSCFPQSSGYAGFLREPCSCLLWRRLSRAESPELSLVPVGDKFALWAGAGAMLEKMPRPSFPGTTLEL